MKNIGSTLAPESLRHGAGQGSRATAFLGPPGETTVLPWEAPPSSSRVEGDGMSPQEFRAAFAARLGQFMGHGSPTRTSATRLAREDGRSNGDGAEAAECLAPQEGAGESTERARGRAARSAAEEPRAAPSPVSASASTLPVLNQEAAWNVPALEPIAASAGECLGIAPETKGASTVEAVAAVGRVAAAISGAATALSPEKGLEGAPASAEGESAPATREAVLPATDPTTGEHDIPLADGGYDRVTAAQAWDATGPAPAAEDLPDPGDTSHRSDDTPEAPATGNAPRPVWAGARRIEEPSPATPPADAPPDIGGGEATIERPGRRPHGDPAGGVSEVLSGGDRDAVVRWLGAPERVDSAEAPRVTEHIVVTHLVDDIRRLTFVGRERAVLQLRPPELGRLDIHLRSGDGGLSIEMVVETEAVKAVLESTLDQLRSALSEHGIMTAGVHVGVGPSAHREPEAGTLPWGREVPPEAADAGRPRDVALAPIVLPVGFGSTVDYRI